MTIRLFGLNIAKIINDSIVQAGGLEEAILIKVSKGVRDTNNPTAALVGTKNSYSAQGVIINYTDKEIDNTLILRNDRKVILIAESIQSQKIPEMSDQITIEGVTYDIVGEVQRDPAGATYTCQCRI